MPVGVVIKFTFAENLVHNAVAPFGIGHVG
jgi:hypothetical protein